MRRTISLPVPRGAMNPLAGFCRRYLESCIVINAIAGPKAGFRRYPERSLAKIATAGRCTGVVVISTLGGYCASDAKPIRSISTRVTVTPRLVGIAKWETWRVGGGLVVNHLGWYSQAVERRQQLVPFLLALLSSCVVVKRGWRGCGSIQDLVASAC